MEEPQLLWKPSEDFKANSNLTQYIHWLSENRDLNFESYSELWDWSVASIEEFWLSIWEYFQVISHSNFNQVMSNDPMPRVTWFEGASLNYAEHIFRKINSRYPAIIFKSESSEVQEISWRDLESKVASLRSYFISKGITKGDCIVGWLPNIPEAVIGFLAANSLGAIWSSTSPDFGKNSVIDRFAQIEPKILIAADGYKYNGKPFDKTSEIAALIEQLPTLQDLLFINYLDPSAQIDTGIEITSWETAISGDDKLEFEAVPFDHPIWVLYSSGTTGLPKPITHSHGGILLEHLKYLTFHNDVKEGDRFFWYTTTGWMMWNYMVASMLCGSTIVLYDGSPGYPDMNVLWRFASDVGIKHFGTSAPFIIANMKAETHPGKDFDLADLTSIGSTGAPLPPEGFEWIYSEIKKDLWLASISGGSDVCSAFVGGNPLLPVYSGEIQCRALGCWLEAYNEDGKSVEDEVGEMVITEPMPCMPIYFWNDPDFRKYEASYFEMFPGKWRHGDWTRITPNEGVVIYGRSDATLNRGGVRIGTSEIYRVLDKMPEIMDSLIVCVDKEDGEFYMPLFVVMPEKSELTDDLVKYIKGTIREECTPRHVPDEILQIPEVPYTISGKKTETPVKKILMGKDVSGTLNKDALKNPDSLNAFIELAKSLS